MPLYARAGIPESWLVDLGQESITAFRDPSPTGYRFTPGLRRGRRGALLATPDQELAAADILP